MRTYTWEEIKGENGVYATYSEEGYCDGHKLGLFNFVSLAGEITVNYNGELQINNCWNDEIFVKIREI